MNPSFFGPPGEQLLGVHHPARGASRNAGVVICPPAPMEYVRSHWASRKLAELLAKQGFDVLRFDYRGTGDSQGELGDTSAAMWTEDVRRAVKELKELTGVRKVSAVGFRFGSLVLARAASEGTALDNVVLWEPIVSVANWLEQLRLVDRQTFRAYTHPPKEDRNLVLGFVLGEAVRTDWERLDLTHVATWPPRTAVVTTDDTAHLQRLRRAFTERGQAVDWHHVQTTSSQGSGVLLGNEPLERIAQWLGERR